MFVDEAVIYVRAGKGGHGCVSFRREKYLPLVGPDGGDGGDGGNVILRAVEGIDTLLDFAGRHHWITENGRPGQGKNMTGRSGRDLVIDLPPGTLVHDAETGVLLKDLTPAGTQTIITGGGKGGEAVKPPSAVVEGSVGATNLIANIQAGRDTPMENAALAATKAAQEAERIADLLEQGINIGNAVIPF